MTPGELGAGPAEAASGWAARVTSPRVLILAAGALVLTNIPLTRYRSGDQSDYFWSSLGVLLVLWQLWGRQWAAWALMSVATAAALPIDGLSAAGVLSSIQPGWWMLITGPANIVALFILVSPPIRRWVATKPAPVP